MPISCPSRRRSGFPPHSTQPCHYPGDQRTRRLSFWRPLPLYFAHLAGERQLKIGAQGGPDNRTVERERRFPRLLERFLPGKWIASAILVKILILQIDQNGGW